MKKTILTLLLSAVLILTLFLSVAPVGAVGDLAITEVFSADLDTELPTSQYFDAALGEQYIGVSVTNTGDAALTNVEVSLSVDPDSDITLLETSQDYGTVEDEARTTRLFLVDFTGVAVGDYVVTISIVADDAYSKDEDVTLTVVSSEYMGDDSWTVETADSTIVIETDFDCIGDPTLMGPSRITWTITWNDGYAGETAPVTYDLGALVNKEWAQDRVFECCGIVIEDNTLYVYWLAAYGQAANVISDPFGMGQAETPPDDAAELTTEEQVVMDLTYGAVSNIGRGFDAETDFEYTRTTDATSYTATLSEADDSVYAITEEQVNAEVSGNSFVITASTDPSADTGYYVSNVYEAEDTALTNPLLSIVMQDDGQDFDRTLNDGTYTGDFGDTVLPTGVYIIATFGFEFEPGSWSPSSMELYPPVTIDADGVCAVGGQISITAPSTSGQGSVVVNN